MAPWRPLASTSANLRIAVAGCALAGFAFVLPAPAAEIAAASRIDTVTVYPDAATVARVVDVNLPQGQSSLVFAGLPASLDPSSLRVTGQAAGKLTILAVDSNPAPVESKPDSGLEARLKALRSEREGWQSTLDALAAKKAMMLRFSQAGPEKLSADAKPLDIAEWNNAWDTVGVGLAKVGDDLRAANARARELDDQIKALEAARQPLPRKFAPATDVSVELVAESATEASVTLTYRVSGAGWRPTYEARLDTSAAGAAPSLDFVRRAEVTQRTGEDWSGVALTVSTLRAARGTSAPDLETERITFLEPPVFFPNDASAPRAAQRSLAAQVPTEAAPPTGLAMVPQSAPLPAQEQQTSLDAGAYQAVFHVPGRLDVPGDGSVKTLRIASRTLTPGLRVKAVPALDPTAYLQARFVNDEDVPLLPGDLTLERDGNFIGKGHVAFAAPGDNVDLGLGADDKIMVTRTPVRAKENEPTSLGQSKVVTREFRTTIKNLHDFAVTVSVVDRIPVSENNAIVVEQSPTTTPATDKIAEDKRGIMRWTYDVAPGGTKEIRLGYRMKWPADRNVVYETVASSIAPR